MSAFWSAIDNSRLVTEPAESCSDRTKSLTITRNALGSALRSFRGEGLAFLIKLSDTPAGGEKFDVKHIFLRNGPVILPNQKSRPHPLGRRRQSRSQIPG